MAVIQLKDGNGNLVYFDVTGTGTANDPYVPVHQEVTQQDIYNLLTVIAERLEFGNIKSPGHKLKVDLVDSGAIANVTTVGTVTTCSTVSTVSALTNQVRIGDMQAQRVVEAQMDAAFAAGFTNHITF